MIIQGASATYFTCLGSLSSATTCNTAPNTTTESVTSTLNGSPTTNTVKVTIINNGSSTKLCGVTVTTTKSASNVLLGGTHVFYDFEFCGGTHYVAHRR